MSELRGFGMTFDLASGGARSWYVDGEGAKRWVDNDEIVRGLAGLQDAAIDRAIEMGAEMGNG